MQIDTVGFEGRLAFSDEDERPVLASVGADCDHTVQVHCAQSGHALLSSAAIQRPKRQAAI